LSAQEEKDLRRVFETLAFCAKKEARKKQLETKQAERDRLTFRLDNENFDDDNAEEELGFQVDVLEQDMDTLLEEVKRIDEHPNKTISAADLDLALRKLGKPSPRKDIEYMIWEIDENLDGVVDWDEFRLMYHRNMHDASGLEPFEVYNISQFMTFDHDGKGFITEDDTMTVLFMRHGRAHVEKEMIKLFGDKLKAKGGEGTLTLEQYLAVVSVRNPRMREHRLDELMKQVEAVKPSKSHGKGKVEHERTWRG